MNLLTEEQLLPFNSNRLKRYLKSLRIRNSSLKRTWWWCESCNEYHIPDEKDMTESELKILKEIKDIIKIKYFVKERLTTLEEVQQSLRKHVRHNAQ